MEEILLVPQEEKEIIGSCNDTGVCFLGETDSLISYADISTHFNVTEGSLNTTSEANKWLHFTLDDKELMVSKVAIRYNISWDQLYAWGLVYGLDGVGYNPVGTPTNQFKTIVIGDSTYLCRLLKGADSDPSVVAGSYNPIGTRQSEWSRLLYPIITDDPNITSYTGPMLGNFTMVDLQLWEINTTETPGYYNWCQETPSNGAANRACRGRSGPSRINYYPSSTANNNFGWRAVLELVE